MEVHLDGRISNYALAHVTNVTLGAYVGHKEAFVLWYESLDRPRKPLPAEDLTVNVTAIVTPYATLVRTE